MPIFHDHYETPPRKPLAKQPFSSEPQRAGHVEDVSLGTFQSNSHSGNPITFPSHLESDPTSPGSSRKQPMLNRRELIERIKRGNSPSWPHLQSVSHYPAARLFSATDTFGRASMTVSDAHRRMELESQPLWTHDPPLEIGPGLHSSLQPNCSRHAPRLLIPSVTTRMLGLRLNVPGLLYTRGISEKRRRLQHRRRIQARSQYLQLPQ
jgi:hypothetical protein